MFLLPFWALCQLHAVYGRAGELSDFIKNFLICGSKMKESLTGLEPHESEYLGEYSFLGELYLIDTKAKRCIFVHLFYP